MNCGKIYGRVALCQRSFVHGFPLLRQYRLQTFFWRFPFRVWMIRLEYQRRISLFSRFRKEFQLQSVGISRACVKQVEYVVAQQIRRAQQAGSFYFKLCGSAMMYEITCSSILRLLTCIRMHFRLRSQAIILSASSLPFFCWNDQRISEKDLMQYRNELEAVACLRRHSCSLNQKSAVKCNPSKAQFECVSHFHDNRLEDPWEIFINQDGLLVWRREVPNHRGEGLYEYKVYGVYNDITAVDFLAVHVDCEFRKEWDSSAVSLEILEEEAETNSEVVYWEMQWPRMMSNRDYVYKRRYIVSEEHNVIVLVNQNTQHPLAPVKPGKQRVMEYWSIIVIKPFSGLDKPGLEFSMTYFDNPGLVFPSAFASWATATGFPDYLNKLHGATLLYADRRIVRETLEKEMEAAAKEEEKKRQEQEERKRKESQKEDSQHSQRKFSPEAWESIMGGGPVLNSSIPTDKSADPSETRNTLINKLVFMVS